MLMKLRQLQCLCAVVDAGFNISRAAAILHATQPAVGKQVRELESELGIDLLHRQCGRAIGLTDGGERALAWARRALQCAENIKAVARENGDQSGGSIVLATSHAHATHVLLPAIVAFSRRFPKVSMNVLQGTPDHVAELVRDGSAALGITHLPAQVPKELLVVPFLTSPRVLVVPQGHPLLKEKTLTLEKLAAHPVIAPYSSRPEGARILRKFQEANLQVNLVVQALNADVVKTYVGAGLGVGIIPAFSYSARRDRGLRMREVGHLFDPAVSVLLLRRHSHLQHYVYSFIAQLDAALERHLLEKLMMQSE
jgi:LysR family cys regulon transcriptional activator